MRVLKVIIPVILTVALFGVVFYVTLQNKSLVTGQPNVNTSIEDLTDTDVLNEVRPGPEVPYGIADSFAEGSLYAQSIITHLILYSGLGVQLNPKADEIQLWLDTSDQLRAPFENGAYLRAPFVRGNATLLSENLDLLDALTYRWDTSERHSKVTPSTIAEAMQSDIALASWYASTGESEYEAIALGRLASEGMTFLEENIKTDNGLYASAWQGNKIINPTVTIADQATVLEAYARFIDYADTFTLLYISPVEVSQARETANAFFKSIDAYVSEDETRLTTLPQADLARLMGALAWFATVTDDESLRTEALSTINDASEALLIAERTTEADQPFAVEAAKVRGMTLAHFASSDARYRRYAEDAWERLESRWDPEHMLYRDDPEQPVIFFTPGDIASVVAAYRLMSALDASAIDVSAEGEGDADVPEGDDAESDTTEDTKKDVKVEVDIPERFKDTVRLIKMSGMLTSEERAAFALIPGDPVPLTSDVHKAPAFVGRVGYMPASWSWTTLDANVDTADELRLATELLLFTESWETNASSAHGIPLVVSEEEENKGVEAESD